MKIMLGWFRAGKSRRVSIYPVLTGFDWIINVIAVLVDIGTV
jgi:hypothetical protein